MSLFESGLLGQAKPGEFACFDAVPKNFTKIFLQDFELHGRSIAPGYGGASNQKSGSDCNSIEMQPEVARQWRGI